jgi:DNA-binding transcriptional LysR family regulator
MQYSMTDFQLFASVAELSNLTRVAERCNLSLAAVSSRIHAMEERANCKLLERRARGVALTPAGETFARHARVMLLEAEALGADLSGFAGGAQGHVVILANTTAVTEFMPAVLSGFLASHPHVSVTLREQSNLEITRAVREGRAELGIVAGDMDLAGLNAMHLATDSMVLVAHRKHRLAGRAAVAFKEVVGEAMVGMREGSSVQEFIARQVQAVGHSPVRPRVHVNSYESVCLMVQAGVGIAIVPRSAAMRYSGNMQLAVVPFSDPWALRERYLVMREAAPASGYLRELVTHIREHQQR